MSRISAALLTTLLATLLFLAGGYLSISWFFGYAWAGVWHMGALQNVGAVIVGLYFSLIWLGFVFSRTSHATYRTSVSVASFVAAILLLDQLATNVLPLRTGPEEILFSLIALGLVVLRRPARNLLGEIGV